MDQRIIYPTDDGGVAIIVPAPGSGLTLDEIARKDVPPGRPYKIISADEVPDDRTFRGAWTYEE